MDNKLEQNIVDEIGKISVLVEKVDNINEKVEDVNEKIKEVHEVIYKDGLFKKTVKNEENIKWIKTIGGWVFGVLSSLVLGIIIILVKYLVLK